MIVCVVRCYDIIDYHVFFFFFFNDTATTEIYTLSLHDALPISWGGHSGLLFYSISATRNAVNFGTTCGPDTRSNLSGIWIGAGLGPVFVDPDCKAQWRRRRWFRQTAAGRLRYAWSCWT